MKLDQKPPAPSDLAELQVLSRQFGETPELVQGAGGNTSVKNGNVLWVKASGTWLKDAEEHEILVPVALPRVLELLESGNSDFNSATLYGSLRPSIETSLHCQLPQHVVAHVHSVNAIAWSVQPSAESKLAELLSDFDWRYVPYAKPGASLTAAVNEVLAAQPGAPSVLLLENHGLVVGGDSANEVQSCISDIESRLRITPRKPSREPNTSMLKSSLSELDGWRLPKHREIHSIALDQKLIEIATSGVLIPDHAVFLEHQVPVCDYVDQIKLTIDDYMKSNGYAPHWLIVKDVGVILSEELGVAGEDQLWGLSMIGLRIPSESEVRYIDKEAAAELRAWDAETYRKKLDDQLSNSNA